MDINYVKQYLNERVKLIESCNRDKQASTKIIKNSQIEKDKILKAKEVLASNREQVLNIACILKYGSSDKLSEFIQNLPDEIVRYNREVANQLQQLDKDLAYNDEIVNTNIDQCRQLGDKMMKYRYEIRAIKYEIDYMTSLYIDDIAISRAHTQQILAHHPEFRTLNPLNTELYKIKFLYFNSDNEIDQITSYVLYVHTNNTWYTAPSSDTSLNQLLDSAHLMGSIRRFGFTDGVFDLLNEFREASAN